MEAPAIPSGLYSPGCIYCIITSSCMCCSQTFTCGIRNRSYICCIRSQYCICCSHIRNCRSCSRSFLPRQRKQYAPLPGQPSLQRMTGCTGYWRRILPYIPASINCSYGSRSRRQLLCRPCLHRPCSHNKLHFHNYLHSHNRYHWQHMLHLHSRLSRHNSHYFHYNHHIHYNSYFIFSFQLGCTLLYGHVRNV